jgi:phospholipid transport system substrate-binding protein
MKKNLRNILFLVLLSSCMQSFAVVSPVTQLQGVATKILVTFDRNIKALRTSAHKRIVHRVINRYLIPVVAINRMAASVLGRNVWQKASSAQRSAFIKQFKYLVINTYATAFASYNRDKIMFYPLRGGYAGKQSLRVSSVIIRKTGQRISVSYNVIRSGSRWSIYDFSIENVSMVHSYRSQFASILNRNGIGALINKLKAHNAN